MVDAKKWKMQMLENVDINDCGVDKYKENLAPKLR